MVEEAVLVKAHLRRKKRIQRQKIGLPELIIVVLVLGIIGASFYFAYVWIASGGWRIIVGGVIGIGIAYSLIKWRKRIFRAKEVYIGWKEYESIDDFPLWIVHTVYKLKYKQNMQRRDFYINGRVHKYKVKIRNLSVPEPTATIGNIRIYKWMSK